MSRQKEWIEEFILNYVNDSSVENLKSAKELAMKNAMQQEMENGAVVDLWTPADAAANALKPVIKISVEELQRKAIENLFDDYDFGEDCEVETFNGWEFDGLGTYSRAVFVLRDMEQDRSNYSDTQDRDSYECTQETQKITFYIEFEPNSCKVHTSGVY